MRGRKVLSLDESLVKKIDSFENLFGAIPLISYDCFLEKKVSMDFFAFRRTYTECEVELKKYFLFKVKLNGNLPVEGLMLKKGTLCYVHISSTGLPFAIKSCVNKPMTVPDMDATVRIVLGRQNKNVLKIYSMEVL